MWFWLVKFPLLLFYMYNFFRCVQLASIFMSGIENAILANDACGSPVPWEFCCPWNFFDGKLFHSKWLQAMMNVNSTELCDGKVDNYFLMKLHVECVKLFSSVIGPLINTSPDFLKALCIGTPRRAFFEERWEILVQFSSQVLFW